MSDPAKSYSKLCTPHDQILRSISRPCSIRYPKEPDSRGSEILPPTVKKRTCESHRFGHVTGVHVTCFFVHILHPRAHGHVSTFMWPYIHDACDVVSKYLHTWAVDRSVSPHHILLLPSLELPVIHPSIGCDVSGSVLYTPPPPHPRWPGWPLKAHAVHRSG